MMRPLAAAIALLFVSASGIAIGDDAADAISRAERALRAGQHAAPLAVLPDPTGLGADLRYRALMVAAEVALAQGRWEEARARFEQAGHPGGCTGAAELGMIRAELQGGAFRTAKAMAGALAYDHPRASEALAMRAFLEDRAGHVERARTQLRELRRLAPNDQALLLVEAELLIDRGDPAAAAASLDAQIIVAEPSAALYAMRARAAAALGDAAGAARWRLDAARSGEVSAAAGSDVRFEAGGRPALPTMHPQRQPYAQPLPLPADAPVVTASGLVLGDGSQVVTTAQLASGRVFVRSGLGAVRSARVERVDAAHGIAWLRLDRPLGQAWHPRAVGELYAGRPSLAIGYPLAGSIEPAWPAASAGINFRPAPGTGNRFQLTAAIGKGSLGAPVFDWQGQLVGFVSGAAGDRTALVGAKRVIDDRFTAVAPAAVPADRATTLEEVYERALPAVVLVVSAPGASNEQAGLPAQSGLGKR